MNITDDFDVECLTCLDTGEYYNGTKMVTCTCKKGKQNADRNTNQTHQLPSTDGK